MATDDIENLAFLAAVLRPRDVAPHPNFRTEEKLSIASLLALLTSARIDDFYRERETEEYSSLAAFEPDGVAMLDSVLTGMTETTVRRGADELSDRSRNATIGPTQQTACTILASFFYAASGNPSNAKLTLIETIDQLSIEVTPIRKLLLAALRQNLAFRRWDEGSAGLADAEDARVLLQDFDEYALPTFEVSKGSSRSSHESLRAITSFLLDANRLYFERASTEWGPRADSLRQKPDAQILEMRNRVAAGLSAFVHYTFRSTIDGDWSPSWAEGDEGLVEALMQAELNGHLSAMELRRLLGKVRYVQGRASSQDWKIEDSLRLLRVSGDKRDFDKALSAVKMEGPLSALLNQANGVLQDPPAETTFGQLHALLFEASSNLLDKDAASAALDLIISSSRVSKIQLGKNWESRDSRLEYLWQAAIALSRRAGREVEVAIAMIGMASQDVSDFYVSRLLGRIDKRVWADAHVKSLVRQYLNQSEKRDSETGRFLKSALQLEDGPLEDIPQDKRLDLAGIADLLNMHLVRGYVPSDKTLEQMREVLLATMEQTRENARKGMFSAGALPECELAIVFSMAYEYPPLWGEISSYLLDPLLQRLDKTPALRRLTRFASNLPVDFVNQLRREPANLLSTTTSFFEGDINPYPDAVRLIAALQLLPESQLVVLCGRLLSSNNPRARSEGTETLQVVAKRFPTTDWVYATAISASFDSDYGTRAEAALTLAYMRRDSSAFLSEIDHRLASLLEEDGSLIPLRVMSGLQNTEARLSAPLLRKVRALAATHLHATVRARAVYLLENLGQVN